MIITPFVAAISKIPAPVKGSKYRAVVSAFYTAYAVGCQSWYHQDNAVNEGIIFG